MNWAKQIIEDIFSQKAATNPGYLKSMFETHLYRAYRDGMLDANRHKLETDPVDTDYVQERVAIAAREMGNGN